MVYSGPKNKYESNVDVNKLNLHNSIKNEKTGVTVPLAFWQQCLEKLQTEYTPQHFNMWLRPLQVEARNNTLVLLAPNRFVVNWVEQNFLEKIKYYVNELGANDFSNVLLEVGTKKQEEQAESGRAANETAAAEINNDLTKNKNINTNRPVFSERADVASAAKSKKTNLNPQFTFDSFVEGKSNQLARAASQRIAEEPGRAYNPLFIYGGVGLGKTHLMYAIGNMILQNNPDAKILYLHSERFVGDMVKALQTNSINEFKRLYRSLNVLLIDDIQFFAGKDRSQEEFFHTFNSLLEGEHQIILTSDRYPKEIDDIEERLKSRFGWGLTVAVEPPDLETRVAILMSKAKLSNIELPYDIAFFIAKRIRSNVRELEGALRRVIASAQFTGRSITIEFVQDALRDLLALHDRLVTIDNIIKTVAEYYKIKVIDILSKRRNRTVTRPRQMAMSLAKELTNHSLPEIGEAFGGKDHTTVIHACRKVKSLVQEDNSFSEDFKNLMRILAT